MAEPTGVIVEELTASTAAVCAVGDTSGKFAGLGPLSVVDEIGNISPSWT
jgi:hypothetical protein